MAGELRFNSPVIDEIFEIGAAAARAGAPEEACPFPDERSTLMTLRQRWLLGHRSAAQNKPIVTSCCGD